MSVGQRDIINIIKNWNQRRRDDSCSHVVIGICVTRPRSLCCVLFSSSLFFSVVLRLEVMHHACCFPSISLFLTDDKSDWWFVKCCLSSLVIIVSWLLFSFRPFQSSLPELISQVDPGPSPLSTSSYGIWLASIQDPLLKLLSPRTFSALSSSLALVPFTFSLLLYFLALSGLGLN